MRGSALVVLAIALAGCSWLSPEQERRRFDCNGLSVVISTRSRMPEPLGGEEYVYASLSGRGAGGTTTEIDNDGRWTDRLSASMAADGTWVRLAVEDARGQAAGRYRYFVAAFLESATGKVVRTTVYDSTDEERASGMFDASATLPAAQTLRGREVAWQPCADAGRR